MKWMWIAAALITVAGLVLGVLALLGARLPREHVATRRVTLARSPEEVFAVVRDFAGAPSWRTDVKRVEVLVGDRGVRFREESRHGSIAMEVVEDVPPRRLVTRIADDGLPFGGTWTYELGPTDAGGTAITIMERGFVRPAVFRALARYVFTYHRTLDTYLRALGTRFGQTVTPSGS
jgi:uncharacterized protein YndB with AHSA1/START domain